MEGSIGVKGDARTRLCGPTGCHSVTVGGGPSWVAGLVVMIGVEWFSSSQHLLLYKTRRSSCKNSDCFLGTRFSSRVGHTDVSHWLLPLQASYGLSVSNPSPPPSNWTPSLNSWGTIGRSWHRSGTEHLASTNEEGAVTPNWPEGRCTNVIGTKQGDHPRTANKDGEQVKLGSDWWTKESADGMLRGTVVLQPRRSSLSPACQGYNGT